MGAAMTDKYPGGDTATHRYRRWRSTDSTLA